VVHGWPGAAAGGTGLYTEALATALAADGHAVAVICPRSRTHASADPTGVLRWPLADPAATDFEDAWARRAALAAWRRFQRAWRPDVVHIHHLSGLPLGLPEAARQGGARVVLTLHDYATICARGQLVDAELRPCPGPAPDRCARCLGPHLQLNPLTARIGRFLAPHPRLRTAARDGLGAASRPGHRARGRVVRRLRAAGEALDVPHVLLSPSKDLAARVARLGWRRPSVLPLPLLRPMPAAPEPPPGPVRFLFASSVIPTKGPDRLVEAFARLPVGTALLTIAGPTPPFDGHEGFGGQVRSAVHTTPGARWAGAVPAESMASLLADHDVLVLPSTWPENSPLVVREATAAGLRVVASSAGGAAELDPDLRAVDPDAGVNALADALRAESERGRGRRTPLSWPTPAEHSRTLSTGVYTES